MLELARESDFDSVNAIARQVQAMHVQWRPDIYCAAQEPYDLEFFRECIRQRILFVAKLDGIVVGYLRFYIWQTNGNGSVKRKVVDLDDICVDERFRNCGVGTQMMQEFRVLAKAFGCTDMQLSVYPQNDAAVAFYQKCGFTIRNINMQRKV